MMTRRMKADMIKEADEVKSSEVITQQQLAGTPGLLLLVYCCNLVACWCISIVLQCIIMARRQNTGFS
jgi:hypothetical protein